VDELLRAGGSLSAYRATKDFGTTPAKDSWAWRLEREIEKNFKVKHAVACNSGTASLHAVLFGVDVAGGEVITSPYTFSATASAILLAGGKPRFADVHSNTFCITKETVKRVVTRKTKAILPVSLFGYRPDYRDMAEFGLPIVEDGCQAVGAQRDGTFLQRVCLSQALSFNGGKNVPAGEGGALVTNSERIAGKARLLMNHAENFGSDGVGYNYRMNELTACVAWHGLKDLDQRNKKRQQLAGILNEIRYFHPCIYRVVPSAEESHVWYVYPFLVRNGRSRRVFAKRMKAKGIHVGQGYTKPLHLLPAFRKYARGPLPVVERLWKKELCLLDCVRPPATEEDMRYVAQSMRESLCD